MPLYEFAGRRPTIPPDSWVAPSADLIGDVRLGRWVGVWFGAVIRADNGAIVVGDRTNIQDGAMLHADPDAPLRIGAGCTIGHRAILHGCTVGTNVLVGMGATVLNGATIGDDCLVGAGALVTEGKAFPPGSLVMGSPARVVRDLSPDAIAALRRSADGYVARQRDYAVRLLRINA
ncbi:gamma carbonic anhydrase family protein [Sphingomonas bacterium]|uniref:gamma carbonic anhydrase family protein n=1 Tax=Sphingomonas bacterium TaxID=1895847 RepID=UPI001576BBD7|nr:gamma carbonic anhydrase family protein [Sphingomonas bacterium]